MLETRTFGDADVTVLSHGTAQVPIEWVLDTSKIEDPEVLSVSQNGKQTFDYLSFHVRLRDASVLIDVGPDDLAAEWRLRSPSLTGLVSSVGLQAGLRTISVRPEA
jgi:hypothetical protein